MCENADFEAQQIVLAALGLDLTSFLLKKGEPAPREAVSFCDACVRRRNAGEPLYYILGKTEFYSLPFYVGEGVLIPRQDTETLVDEALAAIGSLPMDAPIRVLDLCAGSGCVGIAIAKFCPQCRVTCVERYDAAFDYLKRNIAQNGADNVTAVLADALEFGGEYDVVVSNPPYLRENEHEELAAEVLCEPKTALFAADEGLYFYKIISRNFRRKCRFILFETGDGQSEAVREILRQNAFCDMRVTCDANGLPRVVSARACP